MAGLRGAPGKRAARRYWRFSPVGRDRSVSLRLGNAFADPYASSTASRNSLHRSHGLAKALRSGRRDCRVFPAELPAIDCRLTIWRHLPVLLTGFLRVACVEFGRHIELGVTFRRCVSSKPAHPVGPTGVAREHVIEMGGMGAVDHVVTWSCTRSPLNRLDCGPERVA